MNDGERPLIADPGPMAPGALPVLAVTRRTVCRQVCRAVSSLAVAAGTGTSLPASALDNPEAPDRVADFLERSAGLEHVVSAAAGGPQQAAALSDYQAFLDTELGKAYELLMSSLDPPARALLRKSQRLWLQHRESEALFVARQFDRARYGSSVPLVRAGFKAEGSKQRVIQLLSYLKSL